jgi:hypothetical protein
MVRDRSLSRQLRFVPRSSSFNCCFELKGTSKNRRIDGLTHLLSKRWGMAAIGPRTLADNRIRTRQARSSYMPSSWRSFMLRAYSELVPGSRRLANSCRAFVTPSASALSGLSVLAERRRHRAPTPSLPTAAAHPNRSRVIGTVVVNLFMCQDMHVQRPNHGYPRRPAAIYLA